MLSTMRSAAPRQVQNIWDVISQAGKGRIGSVDFERLMTLLTSTKKLGREEMNRELECAVKDELALSEIIHTQGDEQKQIYMLPDPDFLKGDHDWYCFHCHLGSEGSAVVSCEICPRIFHLRCLKGVGKPLDSQDRFLCPPCQMLAKKPSAGLMKISREQLNKLVEYSCAPIKDWNIPFMNSSDGETWATASDRKVDEAWRYDYLVYFRIDLTVMVEKATNQKYSSIEEYQVDCDTLMHSIGVYFGKYLLEGKEFPATCHKDISRDVQEIKLCHDCFRLSNEKNQPWWWFCIPCTKPHEVVWAKQSGYPFWPAKVMKKEGSKCDVRFFGGSYDRGVIDIKHIKPIETPADQLSVRRPSVAWNEALEELKKFQEIAINPKIISTLPSIKPKTGKINTATPPKKNSATKPKAAQSKHRASTGETEKVKTITVLNSDGDTPGQSPRSARVTRKSTTNAGTSTPGSPGSPPGSSKAPENERTPVRKRKTTAALVNDYSHANLYESSSSNKSMSVSPTAGPSKGDSLQDSDSLPPEEVSFLKSLKKLRSEGSCLTGNAYSSDEEQNEAADGLCSVNGRRNVYVQTSDGYDKLVAEHVAAIKERHTQEILAMKKRQWCSLCMKEASYFCCWNTSYCSQDCQLAHWTNKHKRSCLRKRN